MREPTLDRLIRVGLVAVLIGGVLVGASYLLDGRGGDSLPERRLAAAEDAVRSQPNEIGLRLALAEAYRAVDRPDSALEQYDEVLGAEPGQGTALLGRAQVLAAKGDLSEAASSFEQIIRAARGGELADVDPRLEAAYYGYGSVLLEQGSARKAMAVLERAVQIEPTDADSLYLLGTAAVEAEAPRRGVEALRRAVRLVPTGWCDPYERLAEAYAALGRAPRAEQAGAMVDLCEGRPADAVRRLRPLTAGPAAVDAMLGLGMVAEAESDRAGAIRWYRKVLAADAESFTALTGLSRLGVPAPPGRSPAAGHPPLDGGAAR